MAHRTRETTTLPSTPVTAQTARDLPTTEASSPRWVLPVVLLVVAVVFGRIVGHEFGGFDDVRTLYANERLNPPTLAGLLWFWTHAELAIYIPVTYTVWSAIAAVAYLPTADERGIHLNPLAFHAASLLVHLGTVAVVYGLLRRLVRGRDGEPVGWPVVAVGALLFGLHPLQVESVAWASGMKDLLCGLFSLLALMWYVDYAGAKTRTTSIGGTGPRSAVVSYALATVAVALAMLSKPTAMLTPLLALAVDGLLVRPGAWRASLRALWPWLVMAVVTAVIARAVQPAGEIPTAPLWARPLVVGDALAFYLWKLVAPFRLAAEYGRNPPWVMGQWWFWLTWLVPAGVAVVMILMRQSRPWLLAGAVLAVVPLAPTLGFVPFEFQGYSTVADHYAYLPMAGAALVVASVVARHPSGRVYAVCAAVLLVLAMLSGIQARHWATNRAIWERTVAVNPRSWTAWKSLGEEAFARGDDAMAEACLRRSIDLFPSGPQQRAALTKLLVNQGRHAEAVEQLRVMITNRNNKALISGIPLAGTYAQLGRSLMALGRPTEAVDAFRNALTERPGDPAIQNGLNAATRAATASGATTNPLR
jgi:hypothetical protein